MQNELGKDDMLLNKTSRYTRIEKGVLCNLPISHYFISNSS